LEFIGADVDGAAGNTRAAGQILRAGRQSCSGGFRVAARVNGLCIGGEQIAAGREQGLCGDIGDIIAVLVVKVFKCGQVVKSVGGDAFAGSNGDIG